MTIALNNSLINIGSTVFLRILLNFIQAITLNIKSKLKLKLYACFIVMVPVVQYNHKVSSQKYVPLNSMAIILLGI